MPGWGCGVLGRVNCDSSDENDGRIVLWVEVGCYCVVQGESGVAHCSLPGILCCFFFLSGLVVGLFDGWFM